MSSLLNNFFLYTLSTLYCHILWTQSQQTFSYHEHTHIAMFMGPTWGPPGSCSPQMGPMLAPWTLLSGYKRTSSINCAVSNIWDSWNNIHQSINCIDGANNAICNHSESYPRTLINDTDGEDYAISRKNIHHSYLWCKSSPIILTYMK